jgi:hypothetical protein
MSKFSKMSFVMISTTHFVLTIPNLSAMQTAMTFATIAGTNVIKLFLPKFIDARNKLECLSLASLSSLV